MNGFVIGNETTPAKSAISCMADLAAKYNKFKHGTNTESEELVSFCGDYEIKFDQECQLYYIKK